MKQILLGTAIAAPLMALSTIPSSAGSWCHTNRCCCHPHRWSCHPHVWLYSRPAVVYYYTRPSVVYYTYHVAAPTVPTYVPAPIISTYVPAPPSPAPERLRMPVVSE